MKTILITTILMSFTVSAGTFFIKGHGEAKNQMEDVARTEAIKLAKKDAQLYANWSCWSRQGRGVLLGRRFEIEVISKEMVDHFQAEATALGEFDCYSE